MHTVEQQNQLEQWLAHTWMDPVLDGDETRQGTMERGFLHVRFPSDPGRTDDPQENASTVPIHAEDRGLREASRWVSMCIDILWIPIDIFRVHVARKT